MWRFVSLKLALPFTLGSACAAAPRPSIDVGPPGPASPSEPAAPVARDGRRDFDFLIGQWRVHNRRLRRPLSGSNEWDEFEGTSTARSIIDGLGNMEDWEAQSPTGRVRAVSLHLYNPRTHLWSLYWASSTTGTLDRPTVGRFEGKRGEFYDRDDIEGRSVFVRYVWTSVDPDACRWEQALSADGGRTWETNWVMEFARVR